MRAFVLFVLLQGLLFGADEPKKDEFVGYGIPLYTIGYELLMQKDINKSKLDPFLLQKQSQIATPNDINIPASELRQKDVNEPLFNPHEIDMLYGASYLHKQYGLGSAFLPYSLYLFESYNKENKDNVLLISPFLTIFLNEALKDPNLTLHQTKEGSFYLEYRGKF
ncbi:hypothetical protein [uncultured Campylobacter sp.]|uniref:hypothetical protein n=1 Tax=uncultured Campylobacter sp. TaxID=218934 RepID=UPI002608511D|nr:hypothetical protein [uncultured Campylobacter sp.]